MFVNFLVCSRAPNTGPQSAAGVGLLPKEVVNRIFNLMICRVSLCIARSVRSCSDEFVSSAINESLLWDEYVGESCVSNLGVGKKSWHRRLVWQNFIDHTTWHQQDAFIPSTWKRPQLGEGGWEISVCRIYQNMQAFSLCVSLSYPSISWNISYLHKQSCSLWTFTPFAVSFLHTTYSSHPFMHLFMLIHAQLVYKVVALVS